MVILHNKHYFSRPFNNLYKLAYENKMQIDMGTIFMHTLFIIMGYRICRSAIRYSPPYISPAATYIGVLDGKPRVLRNNPTSLGVRGQYPLALCSIGSISLTFHQVMFSLKFKIRATDYLVSDIGHHTKINDVVHLIVFSSSASSRDKSWVQPLKASMSFSNRKCKAM